MFASLNAQGMYHRTLLGPSFQRQAATTAQDHEPYVEGSELGEGRCIRTLVYGSRLSTRGHQVPVLLGDSFRIWETSCCTVTSWRRTC